MCLSDNPYYYLHNLERHGYAHEYDAVYVVLLSREVCHHTAHGQYEEDVVQYSACAVLPSSAVALGAYALYLLFQGEFFLCNDSSTTN